MKSLADLERLEAQLRVTCPKCDHSAVYEAKGATSYFLHRGWNIAWDAAGTRFRCERCGTRGARLSIEPIPKPFVPPPLQPTESDRKAEIRRRRG